MAEYETHHPELQVPLEREEQFFGPRNIGGGKLDKYTRLVFVPAVREALDEVTERRGAIAQLVEMIVLKRVNAREDIQRFQQELRDQVARLYSSDNLQELGDSASEISMTLAQFAPGAALRLSWADLAPPRVVLPATRVSLLEDSFEGDVGRKGHGLRRALIVSLLQHLATLSETPAADQATPDGILAFEEPELYLHP